MATTELEFTLSKTYDPAEFEEKTYQMWMESGVFHATPDDRPADQRYVIMMPLPNVTGALHMGHAMDNVMQDMLIRWHRMEKDNALWMPGTDHAGIATQAVVEKRLKELEGLTRHDVGREGLIERIWHWKEIYQARIISQLQRMGCSCDWDRQRFTMDAIGRRAVRHIFFKMFRDSLIFRGKRLVNWDTFLQTSISDDEVYHKNVKGHFWHLRYPVIDPGPEDPAFVEVATTRPETMLGDTAVAVHPDPEKALDEEVNKLKISLDHSSDKDRPQIETRIAELETRKIEVLPSLIHLRDMALAGKKIRLPLLNRTLELICDEWAKPGLGSGCVKITPAHDPNDYDVWTRHKEEIDIINILNPDGTLNKNAGQYKDLDRFEARTKVIADLDAQNLLGKIEDREIEIGHSDRSKTAIEPYLSDQWYVRMGDVEGGVVMADGTDKSFTAPGLVQSAIDAANDGRVSFHPARYKKTYIDWLSEKRDWPISRQLWWGHQIPIWSLNTTAETVQEELNKIFKSGVKELCLSQKAFVRIVSTEDNLSIPVTDSNKKITLPKTDTNKWLIDVCLVEDDQTCIENLTTLGFERDPDVLDTWFSSALWPHSTLGWPDPETADSEASTPTGKGNASANLLDYFYPGSCLVTGRDIITLWVARMVITGLYNLGDIPFSDVFIHANILDGKGERMSKSKGNGIDPVDIIAEYGVDAMRFVLCDMQTGNQDIRLPVTAVCPLCKHHIDLSKAKHGRNIFTYICTDCKKEFDVLGTMPDLPSARLISDRFLDGKRFCNKLWNTARFALANLSELQPIDHLDDQMLPEDRWILAAMNEAIRNVQKGLEEYTPSHALSSAREFMWGSLCDWYLELIKPRLQAQEESGEIARQILSHCLDQTLRLLHPFVPFITEHIYMKLNEALPNRGLGRSLAPKTPNLISASWPTPIEKYDDPQLLETFAKQQELVSGIRETRSSQQISPKKSLKVTLRPPADFEINLDKTTHIIKHMANVSELIIDPEAKRLQGSIAFMIDKLQILVHDVIDEDKERARLQKLLKHVKKEITMCEKKLNNKGFISRAPEAVVKQQKDRLSKYTTQKEATLRSLNELQ